MMLCFGFAAALGASDSATKRLPRTLAFGIATGARQSHRDSLDHDGYGA